MRADHSSGFVACSPINMAASSLLTLNELQEQLDKFNRLAAEELSKQADCNGGLVALYQKQAESCLHRWTGRHQVRSSIMGLRCAERCHLPQAEQQGVDGRGIRCSFTPVACEASRQRMLQLHKTASIRRSTMRPDS